MCVCVPWAHLLAVGDSNHVLDNGANEPNVCVCICVFGCGVGKDLVCVSKKQLNPHPPTSIVVPHPIEEESPFPMSKWLAEKMAKTKKMVVFLVLYGEKVITEKVRWVEVFILTIS